MTTDDRKAGVSCCHRLSTTKSKAREPKHGPRCSFEDCTNVREAACHGMCGLGYCGPHLADCTECLRGPYCPECFNGDGLTCVPNRPGESKDLDLPDEAQVGPKRRPTPEWCERCVRNEPRRFCKWCQCLVCTEQCWVSDEPPASRCFECLGKGEQEQVPEDASSGSAGRYVTSVPADPWTEGASPGGVHFAWRSCSLVNPEPSPSAAEYETCSFVGGTCAERASHVCAGDCEKGFCQRHIFQCRRCHLHPLCHDCIYPYEHECFVDCEDTGCGTAARTAARYRLPQQ